MTELNPYKKSWIIITRIARDMICLDEGDRIPTVQEYTELFDSSRGIIQTAMQLLQQNAAVELEKRGKTGCFLKARNFETLFRMASLEYIIGSMPPPLASHYSALASGICASMALSPANFNFSFMHSAAIRARALSRAIFDFTIVSKNTARQLIKDNDKLSIAMELDNCLYGQPFQLLSNIEGISEFIPGARIAADPDSPDQYSIALKLVGGDKDKIVASPYMNNPSLLRRGEVDFTLGRHGEGEDFSYVKSIIPVSELENSEMTVPVILVNSRNYGIDRILKKYLDTALISQVQSEVMSGKREAAFY